MALVFRDAFGREEIHRERYYDPSKTCAWCGQVKTTPKLGKRYLYRYRIETDGGRSHNLREVFCSESCRRDYEQKDGNYSYVGETQWKRS